MRHNHMSLVYRVAFTLFFIMLSLLYIFPLLCLLLGSLKPSSELMRIGLNLRLDPDVMSLDNYTYLFHGEAFILSGFLTACCSAFSPRFSRCFFPL